jgi:hypothetical protein
VSLNDDSDPNLTHAGAEPDVSVGYTPTRQTTWLIPGAFDLPDGQPASPKKFRSRDQSGTAEWHGKYGTVGVVLVQWSAASWDQFQHPERLSVVGEGVAG